MPLKIDQRLERLQARLRETAFWRARETREIDGWRCDGAPIAIGAPWPSRDGIVRFASKRAFRRLAARRDAPVARPGRRRVC